MKIGDKVRIINDGHTIWGGLHGKIIDFCPIFNEWVVHITGPQGIKIGQPEERLELLPPD